MSESGLVTLYSVLYSLSVLFEVLDRVAPGVLLGKERICLAITEPTAGSPMPRASGSSRTLLS